MRSQFRIQNPILGYIVEYEPEAGLRLSISKPDNTQVLISFFTATNKSYQLQAASTLGGGWTNRGGIIAGTDSVISISGPVDVGTNQIYRVAVSD